MTRSCVDKERASNHTTSQKGEVKVVVDAACVVEGLRL